MHALVFCPPFGGIGGIEVVAANLVRQLTARGHTVTIVARGPQWSDDRASDRRVRHLALPMHQFPRRTRHVARVVRFARGLGPVLRPILRALRTDQPPDLIFSLAVPNYAPYPIALAWWLGRPLVVGLHADPAHLARDANRTLYRFLLRRAARLIACSERVAAATLAEVPTCRARLTVIPNGYDPSEFGGAAARAYERPFLLAVARLVPEKGIDVLIAAFAAVASEFPGVDLVIAGDGPEAAGLAALANAADVGARTRFAGFTDRPSTIGLLLDCEFVCCPSRWESFSLVALEAAAAGKAVVAADAGALPELVRDSETGILVRGHDAAAWATALRALLADPGRARVLGEQARARTRDFTWERVGDRYVEVLETVSDRNTSSRSRSA